MAVVHTGRGQSILLDVLLICWSPRSRRRDLHNEQATLMVSAPVQIRQDLRLLSLSQPSLRALQPQQLVIKVVCLLQLPSSLFPC
jgi:hypothetical protein